MYNATRSRFTKSDLDFIAQTLGKNAGEQSAIMRLTGDPAVVTDLLHERKLFERSMTVPPVFLSVSPQLFFYVFVYQALDCKRLADDDVVDYVAGICVEFRTSHAVWQFSSKEDKCVYGVDLLNLLPDVDKHQQYFLRRHIGNVSLFLTGFFPDFIFHRSKSKGAPPIEYYENLGRSQYETAADDSPRYDAGAAPVLNALAEQFGEIRTALNLYTDAYLNLHHQKHTLDTVERQAATLDEESFRKSLEL